MPILHGAHLSPFVRKVRVALAEKSIEYESIPVVPFNQTDEYLAKSPLGKIPCWEDGDFILPDSSCILAYLERIHPSPALYPSDPKEYGRTLWYEEYSDSKLIETIGPVFFERFIKKNVFQQETDEERVANQIKAAEPLFDYLNGEIGDRDVLVGKHFTVADIAIGSVFANFEHAGERVDASRWPQLAAYVDRIHARPSYKQILEEEKASVTA